MFKLPRAAADPHHSAKTHKTTTQKDITKQPLFGFRLCLAGPKYVPNKLTTWLRVTIVRIVHRV